MYHSLASALLILYLVATFFVLIKFALHRRLRRPLPPGPLGLPIIGNVLQIPQNVSMWLTFAYWGRRYGDIVHLSMLGRSTILLSSPTAIHELLKNRSAIYSDRPHTIMACELVGWQEFLPLSPYGERSRQFRKVMSSVMGPRNAEKLHSMQEQNAHRFASRLQESPAKVRSHIRWLIANTAIKVITGFDVETLDDPLVQLADKAVFEFGLATTPGAHLVDMIPILKYMPSWFPGAGFKAQAKAWRETVNHVRDDAYGLVKEHVAQDSAAPSLLTSLLQNNVHPDPQLESIYRHISGTAYTAAVDTTVAGIEWFFLAMTLHPDVQRKAQAEVDGVIETGRLPSFSDRPKLPYVEALIKEVYRWNPVAPLGLPHRLTRDDVYEGYHIPAGSTVIANIWAVFHDPVLYSEPSDFNPDRFFNRKSNFLNPDPRSFAFGFGRRLCPGMHLADDMLFITVVTTLAAFNIEKAVDRDGRPITPVVHCENGVVSAPGPFECRVTPRSAEMMNLREDA
ncbi:Multifunctional cytochrome P450 monooxygenase af510 [Sparassis crispa]|uniref:Multifunctional cytochrome P450 monooxygenase af510 n=1 Tax=Sparassis crispa TaxID=139825 RepID=A0A401GKS1_9APHY|nr:Multifunctional cytochrome P450 monooxygenase af510 [Sparassis crispa]GBE82771.1 Multifunctional cytochrome P450 monooxygenase af510 [Sparassis crispa]